MAERRDPPEGGDKAKDLAEKAVETAMKGDAEKARTLAEKAKSMDPEAARGVADEIEKDRKDAEKHSSSG